MYTNKQLVEDLGFQWTVWEQTGLDEFKRPAIAAALVYVHSDQFDSRNRIDCQLKETVGKVSQVAQAIDRRFQLRCAAWGSVAVLLACGANFDAALVGLFWAAIGMAAFEIKGSVESLSPPK